MPKKSRRNPEPNATGNLEPIEANPELNPTENPELKTAKKPARARKKAAPGRKPELTDADRKRLEELLLEGPEKLG